VNKAPLTLLGLAVATETTRVTAQPDGTMRFESSTVPVRVKQGGEWVPVDLSLTSSGGRLAPKASAIPMMFGAGRSTELARVATSTGAWLTETWPLGTLPTPMVSGTKATYPSVLPGVDLVLSATPVGMSEVLVVKTASAAKNPTLAALSVWSPVRPSRPGRQAPRSQGPRTARP
jgi:hypothetical protein